jgi:hypothetical protein
MAVLIEDSFEELTTVSQIPTPENNFTLTVIRKSFIWSYRIAAIFTLYGVLVGVFAYVFLMAFYASNHSWVAPIIISPVDDKSLDMTVKMLQTEIGAEALVLDVKKLQASLPELRQHRAALIALAPRMVAALARENAHNVFTGQELSTLSRDKHNDNVKTAPVMEEVRLVEAQIDKDLNAGLITKGDAAVAHTSLNQSQATFTDSKIAEVMLKDTILQKTTTTTTLLDTLGKQAELRSRVSQLDISIDTAERQILVEQQQIDTMRRVLNMARRTPYYQAITRSKNVNFAFVPYSNKVSVHIGSPVFECYLNVIVCRQVGTVKAFFSEEQHAVHPLFRTDVRGFLVEIELTHPDSAESATLLLNRKPFFF